MSEMSGPATRVSAQLVRDPAMTSWKSPLLVFLLGALVVPAWSTGLPPASPEIGRLYRNAQGKLEVVAPALSNGAPANDPPPTSAAGGKTIVVGPREAIRRIDAAAALAQDGDSIDILPGDYAQQAVVWKQSRLTIRGKGTRPVLYAAGSHAEGKALWVIRNGDIRIENLEFRGARVPDGNGAGIRFENGRLTVRRCAFFDNETGILTSNANNAELIVEDSEFGAAPRHEGSLHHLLYVGRIASLRVTGSRFENGFRGHLLKSRARQNEIAYNWLVDGTEGKASYELEFPNGGVAWVIGNLIGQSRSTENSDVLSYGAEGAAWPENKLVIVHNTLINDAISGRFLRVWNERLGSQPSVWAINNLLLGHGQFEPPATGRFDGNRFADRQAAFAGSDSLAYSLPSNSPLRGTANAPGWLEQRSLLPVAEYRAPVGTQPLIPGKPLSPGARQ